MCQPDASARTACGVAPRRPPDQPTVMAASEVTERRRRSGRAEHRERSWTDVADGELGTGQQRGRDGIAVDRRQPLSAASELIQDQAGSRGMPWSRQPRPGADHGLVEPPQAGRCREARQRPERRAPPDPGRARRPGIRLGRAPGTVEAAAERDLPGAGSAPPRRTGWMELGRVSTSAVWRLPERPSESPLPPGARSAAMSAATGPPHADEELLDGVSARRRRRATADRSAMRTPLRPLGHPGRIVPPTDAAAPEPACACRLGGPSAERGRGSGRRGGGGRFLLGRAYADDR